MTGFVVGIIGILITFYIAVLYASAAIGLFGFAEAVLLVLAFCYLLYYRGRLDASVSVPIAVTEQGGTVAVHIIVKNRSRIPCAKIHYRIRTGSTFLKKYQSRWENGAAVYPGTNHYQSKMEFAHAGNYTVELVRIRVYDLTGLFYMNRKVRRSVGIQVLPEVANVGVRVSERTRNFFGDSDVYDDFRPGDDRSEIFDVREFREGDKIQSIHWKLSAKSDTLVVREDSQPLACPVVLVFSHELHRSLREVEVYLSVAASLVFSLMDAACPHYVAWYSGSRKDIVRARVDDEEGYYVFLSNYLEDGGTDPARAPEELYKEKYRHDHQLHTIVLRSDLTLWQNGEKLAALDGKHWKESVQKLELML